jgi:hypothetical protein
MTPPRRRFRFSIRTVLILTALIGVLVGWYENTEWASNNVQRHASNTIAASSIFVNCHQTLVPFVVRANFWWSFEGFRGTQHKRLSTQYYFWFYGYVEKLPFERGESYRGNERYPNPYPTAP